MPLRILRLAMLPCLLAFVFVSVHARPVPPGAPSVAGLPSFDASNIVAMEGAVGATAVGDTVYFGGTRWDAVDARWEAIRDSVWTFDTGVGSRFATTTPLCTGAPRQDLIEGWSFPPEDTDVVNSAFRRMGVGDFSGAPCVGAPAGLGGDYSLWAGLTQQEADALCWESPGYGNDWDISMAKVYAGPASGTWISFDYRCGVEYDYDYCGVIVDWQGLDDASDDILVVEYTGEESGHESQVVDFPQTTTQYRVRFFVKTDGGDSNEDGGFPGTSCGAFAVDNVSVQGDVSDFESGVNGWEVVRACPGYARLEHVDDLPPVGVAPSACGLSDSVLVFYDPATGRIPAYPPGSGFLWSPWVDLEAEGLMGRGNILLEGDLLGALPQLSYQWLGLVVRTDADTCARTGLPLITVFDGIHHSTGVDADTTCRRFSWVVNYLERLPDDARSVQVGVGAFDYCSFYSGCDGSLQSLILIDNLRIGSCRRPLTVSGSGSGDYPDIQAALDAASDGDVIELLSETFTGAGNRDLDFAGKSLTIRSRSGDPAVCVLDCQNAGPAFSFVTGEGPEARIEGIGIRNAGRVGYGGAILCDGTAPVFRDCVFIDCQVEGSGGAIGAINGASPTVIDCRFESNSATGFGGAISATGGGELTVTGSEIAGNTAMRGGGLHVSQGTILTMTDCVVEGNAADQQGGAAHFSMESSATFERCVFRGNTSSDRGGAVSAYTGVDLTMIDCIVVENTAGTQGGGIGLRLDCTGTLTGCTFAGNGAPTGGGICCDGSSATVDHGILAFGIEGVAAAVLGGGTVHAGCTDVYGNAGGDWVDGLAGQEYADLNRSLDPLFCDPEAGQYTLRADSPCAPENNAPCGLVGALDAGCPITPDVDGKWDPAYGSPIAVDPAGDGNGNAVMDLVELYLAEDADAIYFLFTINADIAVADWGKYVLYLDVTGDGDGATYDAWLRNVAVADPHKPEYSINTWVDGAGPYGPDKVQLFAWNGSSWDGPETIAAAAMVADSVSAIEWKVPKSLLGGGSSASGVLGLAAAPEFWCEVYSTGGGPDPAQDTINDPPDDWNAVDWTTPSVLLCSTAGGAAVTGVEDAEPGPRPLLSATPNPFTADVQLGFSGGAAGTTLRIFDIAGRLVRELHTEVGQRTLRWDGRDASGRGVGPGIYFVHLRGSGVSATRRIVRLR